MALSKSKSKDNSWAEHQIHKRPTELVKRWDYDASRDVWEVSETLVKMEENPFAQGVMRECYRMKKMSQVRARRWRLSALPGRAAHPARHTQAHAEAPPA